VSKAVALAMVSQFSRGTGRGAFPRIGLLPPEFALQLSARISTPKLIDQGRSSLCGPADFLYTLALKNPMAYARYAIDLYRTGSAWIGKMRVAPGVDCRNYVPQGMDAVDWVTLASLRDSSNILLDYRNTGMKLPELRCRVAYWDGSAPRSYYTNFVNDTNVILDKGLWCLLRADQQRASGSCACLFIGSGVLGTRAGGKLVPDHWVVLTTPVMLDGAQAAPLLIRGTSIDRDATLLDQKLSFEVFTWGELRKVGPIKVTEFLDYFYG
jgi:hypothetical protein